MSEALVLTDANLDTALNTDKPVLILISNGDGVRGDFASAFSRAVADQSSMTFARLDPSTNPDAARRFDAGSKPLLIGWYRGAEVLRRSRPWAADLQLALEQMRDHADQHTPAAAPAVTEQAENEPTNHKETVVDTKPVNVTDATFEQDVLAHDLPVVIDFWAPWCGPCRMVAPILDKLAAEYAGKIRIAKVNTDENPGLSQYFQIMSIPTIMMVKERTIVFSQPGALPESALRDLFDQLVALEIPPDVKAKQAAAAAEAEAEADNLN